MMGLYKHLNKVMVLTVSLGLLPVFFDCSQAQVDPSQITKG